MAGKLGFPRDALAFLRVSFVEFCFGASVKHQRLRQLFATASADWISSAVNYRAALGAGELRFHRPQSKAAFVWQGKRSDVGFVLLAASAETFTCQ